MTTTPHRLRTVVGLDHETSRCTIACQARLSGSQKITVRALTPVSGPGAPRSVCESDLSCCSSRTGKR